MAEITIYFSDPILFAHLSNMVGSTERLLIGDRAFEIHVTGPAEGREEKYMAFLREAKT